MTFLFCAIMSFMNEETPAGPHVYMSPCMGRLIFDPENRSYFMSPFFSLDQAATYLGVGAATVRELVRSGELLKRHSGQSPYHVDDLVECASLMKFKVRLVSSPIALPMPAPATYPIN